MTKNPKLLYGILFLLIALGGTGFVYRNTLLDAWREAHRPELPEAQTYESFERPQEEIRETPSQTLPLENTPAPSPPVEREPAGNPLPAQINLAVPFTSQAPHANWELPYQEACEEASLLMVARYKNGKEIASPEDADTEIRALVDFQNNLFGNYKDTTAEETARVAREFYGFTDTEVRYDFTVEDIKRELALGNPVLVPAAGRQLPNPYFHTPGPLYHMLVIRGYTATHFITNDPGTRRGEEFIYTYDDLLGAVHDWNGGDVNAGQKVIIIIR